MPQTGTYPNAQNVAGFRKTLTRHCVNLLRRHFLRRLDSSHLVHDLLQDQQVQAPLALQLVGHVLKNAGQLDAVLLEDGAAEGGQRLQPERDARAVVLRLVLLGVIQGLDDRVAQNVERQARKISKRVDYGPDEIVVQLNLRQDLKHKKAN